MLIDCHNHSLHSFDGHEKVEDILENAVKLGLKVFALTDHCDMIEGTDPDTLRREIAAKLGKKVSELTESDMIGGSDPNTLRREIAASVDEVCRWREIHPTSCKILCGIELGDALENLDLAEEMLALRPYDVVIGSIHTDGNEDYYFGRYDTMTDEEIDASLTRYYQRQIELAKWGKFDVLAHITYPLRYIVGDYGRKVQMERYLPLIDTLFDTIIEKGIALEVNTSGLRQKIGETLPGEALIRRYYGRGGLLITLGSDAHMLHKMACGMDQTEKLLRDIGFTEVVWFDRRKMCKIALPSSLSDKNPV